MGINIRIMETDDIEKVTALGIQMHEESSFKNLDFSIHKCKLLGCDIIQNPNDLFGYVAEDNGIIIGFMLATIGEYYFGYGKIAQDLALFVQKDRRGCMAAINLIKTYEEWALKNGADEIQLGCTTGVDEDRTGDLYKKLGFQPRGSVFKKETLSARKRTDI